MWSVVSVGSFSVYIVPFLTRVRESESGSGCVDLTTVGARVMLSEVGWKE